MKELSHCIVCLLADNDCVILPGIGGFIASYESARYDSGRKMFVSPNRVIGFNSAITLNDGLLVQAYMQVHDLNYPDALRLLEKDMQQVRYDLDNRGAFNIEGVGVLYANNGGAYSFKAEPVDVVTPELYALPGVSAISLKSIDSKNSDKAAESNVKPLVNIAERVELKKNCDDNPDVYVFSLKRPLVHVASVFVAFVVAFLCISFPLDDFSNKEKAKASIVSNVLHDAPQAMQKAANATLLEQSKTTLGETAAKPTGENASAAEHDKVATFKPFTIVLASDVAEKNALAFISELKQKGFSDVRMYEHNNMRRVVYSRFATNKEAANALREIRNLDFAREAWIMKLK